jgi:hypothetical protein
MMKEGKNEYKEKRGKEKKNMCEKIKIWVYKNKIKWTPRFSKSALGISKVSRFKIQTHLSNHVQSGTEDFLCASRSLFAICTCPPISKCVYFSLPLLDTTLFFQWPFWRVSVRPWEACLVLTTPHL